MSCPPLTNRDYNMFKTDCQERFKNLGQGGERWAWKAKNSGTPRGVPLFAAEVIWSLLSEILLPPTYALSAADWPGSPPGCHTPPAASESSIWSGR